MYILFSQRTLGVVNKIWTRKEKNRARILTKVLLLPWPMTETWLSITAHLSPTCSLHVVLHFSLNNTEWREETLWCPNESGITLPMEKKNLAEVYWTSRIDKYSFEKLDRLKGRQFMVIRLFQRGPKDLELLPKNFVQFQCTTFTQTFTRRHN